MLKEVLTFDYFSSDIEGCNAENPSSSNQYLVKIRFGEGKNNTPHLNIAIVTQ